MAAGPVHKKWVSWERNGLCCYRRCGFILSMCMFRVPKGEVVLRIGCKMNVSQKTVEKVSRSFGQFEEPKLAYSYGVRPTRKLEDLSSGHE